MPRLSSLQSDSCGFLISDLPDKNNVRVLAENRPQASCKSHACFGINLNLIYAIELIFDWILDGDDVVCRGLDPVKRSVERGALAASGWAGNEDHPLGTEQ